MILDEPVDFDNIDSLDVDIIASLIVPEENFSNHLELLACLSSKLDDPLIRKELRQARNSSQIIKNYVPKTWSSFNLKVGILIITHSDIGKQLLLTATSVFGKNPFRVELLSVDNYDQPSDVRELAEKYVKFLDNGSGVLVMTDIIGTTPSNIASSINYKNIRVVAGLNLSMLLNVFNYPEDTLIKLTDKAVQGGIEGVSRV